VLDTFKLHDNIGNVNVKKSVIYKFIVKNTEVAKIYWRGAMLRKL